MSLYVSDLIKMERLLKPNPHKSSPLQTGVFRHSLDGEYVRCLYIETRCSWLNYLKQRASTDRQLVAAVITGLLLTVCVVSPPVLSTKHTHRRGIMSSKGKLQGDYRGCMKEPL